MSPELEAFIAAFNGKPVEVEDPSNRDQCMDLAFAWCDFIGINRSNIRNLYAYQVASNYGPDLVEVPGVRPGCFVIFGQAVGPAGHISIGRGGNVQSFDQNWNNHAYAEVVNHSINGIVKYLMPRKLMGGSMADLGQLADTRLTWLNQIGAEVSVKAPVDGNSVPQIINNIRTLYNLIDDKDKQIAALKVGGAGDGTVLAPGKYLVK